MGKINDEYYNNLSKLVIDGGGILPNADSNHNAAAVKFIYDRSFKNLLLYEASPVKDLTSSFAEVAVSFKAYVDSGLPLNIVVPYNRKEMEARDKIPLVIRYVEYMHPKNVRIKIASTQFIQEMTKLLGGEKNDFFSGDDNAYCRVSNNGTSVEKEDKGYTSILNDRYRDAAIYFNRNFDDLNDFELN